jgi:thymidylate synthase (FAD)
LKIAPIQVTYINHCGDDLSVVNAARVSFEKESDWEWVSDTSKDDPDVGYEHFEPVLSQGDQKLITYLAKHKHFSPFNHAFLSFRIKAPIFVARQLVKHKFMPWNEVSRRYVDSEPEFFKPEAWRAKADNVKQGSSESEIKEVSFPFVDYGSYGSFEDYIEICLANYNNLLTLGVCAEQARLVLPVTTMTEWIWSGTLGAFADMLHLRLDPHSQKESRDVANMIYEQALPLFPVSLKALLENK